MIVSLRNLNSAIDIMIGVALAFGVIYAWLVPTKPPPIARRTMVFLVATFLVAPVLVANGVFKEHWSRPRPYHVAEFGGAAPFVQWWDPRGTCKRSCSFFSGEVSAAAWTMAPAVLVPGIMGAHGDCSVACVHGPDRGRAHGAGWPFLQRCRFCGANHMAISSGLRTAFAIGDVLTQRRPPPTIT